MMTQQMTLETRHVKMTQAVFMCRLFATCLCAFEKKKKVRKSAQRVMPACVSAFSWSRLPQCLFTPVHALPAATLFLWFALPLDLLILRRLMPPPPPTPLSLPPVNISSQHSCPLQLSRVHPGEDECAVSMLVENTLYKRCYGLCSVYVCSFLFIWAIERAVYQNHLDSPGSSL